MKLNKKQRRSIRKLKEERELISLSMLIEMCLI